jgi:hypothetical protein
MNLKTSKSIMKKWIGYLGLLREKFLYMWEAYETFYQKLRDRFYHRKFNPIRIIHIENRS